MSPVVEAKLSILEALYMRRADAMAAREAARFRYLSEWREEFDQAIARIIKLYSDGGNVRALETFSPLWQNLKARIPMVTLAGAPYTRLDGEQAYSSTGNDFLGAYATWIDGNPAPYRVSEEIIRNSNAHVRGFLDQFPSTSAPSLRDMLANAGLGQIFSTSLYGLPSLIDVMIKGERLYRDVVVATLDALKIQLEIDDAYEDLRESL